MSPRTLSKVKFQTQKKVLQAKRDIIIQDDEKSMIHLTKFLKQMRGDKQKKQDAATKSKVLQSTERASTAMSQRADKGDINSDFKVFKHSKAKILSDLSQITSQKKKKVAKRNSSIGGAAVAQSATNVSTS